jgi:hypothetical protein
MLYGYISIQRFLGPTPRNPQLYLYESGTVVDAHSGFINQNVFAYKFVPFQFFNEAKKIIQDEEDSDFWLYYAYYPEFHYLRSCASLPGQCDIYDDSFVNAVKSKLDDQSHGVSFFKMNLYSVF